VSLGLTCHIRSRDTPTKITSRRLATTYGRAVGTTGVIFAAIAIAWLAYLVPHFVRRRDEEPAEESDPSDRFSDSIRIVRNGTAPLLDQDLEEIKSYEVSTPQTRQAAIRDLRRLEQLAASRRRRVLLALMAVLSAVVGVCAVNLIPWWSVAIPGGLLLVFVVVARISVHVMHKSLDKRYEAISLGSTEKTVFLGVKQVPKRGTAAPTKKAKAEPDEKPGALWDPVPITVPTYVSKPLAPRTVRTIDLSAPSVTSSTQQDHPVTADAPVPTEKAAAEPRDKADGEETREAASA
jgi:hypothetical protein